ncbi:response regulator [Carboxylicivirga mesophila]|uniref:histidine kinase n=1 Tax=Carboxylicivirga mesophila TaxID=1166478 RepID=A0ABS5K7L5_9BACT|nr:two-component regulator propeller domain-containing protein [Carboxylicivirga mesophila]MBS2210974.1 response regulator [Carboxylicivirga mesophila]
MRSRLLAIIILGYFIQYVAATDYSISAEYITLQDGLSDNNVNAILKDDSGFIWFGTSDGLNRYDGFNLKSYYPEKSSLHVLSLYQCPDGYLWIGSPNGLYVFDPTTESFRAHIKINPAPDNTFNSIPVNGVSGDFNKGVILSTSSGLAILKFADFANRIEDYSVVWRNKTNSRSLLYDTFSCIAKAPDSQIWMGTNTNMVVSYNPTTDQFHSFPLKPSSSGHPMFIVTNLSFIDNHLIISTIGHGIYILNTNTGEIEVIAHQPNDNTIISHKDVYGVVKDYSGDYWIATWDGLDQVHILNNKTRSQHYNWDHSLFKDKLENRVISILSDPSGVIWIGTHGGGAVKINLEKQFFSRIRFNSLYEVKSFSSDWQNNLYIALYHGGIKKTTLPLSSEPTNGIEQFSTSGKGNRFIPSDIVLSSVTDESGNIWFGTLESSLLYYQPEQDIVREIKVKPAKNENWEGRIQALSIDSQGRFWLGTSNGLILYGRDNNEFHLTQANSKIKYQLSGNNIRAILEDKDKALWIGTDNGLNKLIYQELDSFRFNQFNDLHTSSDILGNKEVWALHQMPDGRIWIGYRSALGYYDAMHSTIHFFDKRDGLCHNFVACLTSQANELWIGTNSGISKFNTQTQTFTNYYIANNLRAVFKTPDGQLIFGNNKGLLYFHPDSIQKRDYSTPVYITEIEIQNHPVRVMETVNKKVLLTKAAPYTSAIELHHPINSFAVNFVGLSYLNQKSNKYKYRLSGFEEDWTSVDGTQGAVTFNNLKPGSYRFEVLAANCDEVWNEQPAQLAVTIYPAWYASWWGQLLIATTIILLLTGFYRYRMKQIYRTKDLELQSKELEHELNIARIEKDKEHELAEMKSRFFTNISHELRTPLTLILAPVKDLLRTKSLPEFANKQLEMVHQQAAHLYALISQLLDLRKAEVTQMQLQASENDIVGFIEKLTERFKPFAQMRNVQLIFDSDQSSAKVWFDVEKLQIVVSNLLSNAIKFSPEKSTVSIHVKCKNDECLISVKDSGPGIPESEHEKIFERFYQLQNQAIKDISSSGIGLSLVKELVQLHHGNIAVESKPGKGAEFTVRIPLGHQHLSDAEKGKGQTTKEPLIPEARKQPVKSIVQNEEPNSFKVLIVEDHEELRHYLGSLLSSRYAIQHAANGKEALILIEKEQPDLIITDVMMPLMDGHQLCETIRTDDHLCHIPVIMLTAKSEESDMLEGLETGADDYLTKPFASEILLTKVDNILKNRAHLKQYYSQKVTLSPSNVEIEPQNELFIRQAIELVEKNLTNPMFNAAMLAEKLNMSQPTLYRRIKTFTGDNIATFIRSIRIRYAAQLLKSGNYSVSETATKIGFNDAAYFRKCFVEQFGTTPSKYKGDNTSSIQ